MLRRIEGDAEKRKKHEARRRMKESRSKRRTGDELQALREEVAELREIVELLCRGEANGDLVAGEVVALT